MMKTIVMRALTWLALKGRLYSVWSKLYQWLWERKHLDKHLPPFASFSQVKQLVGAMEWRRDTWLMLWDAISHPVATYHRHQDGSLAGDCDDIAMVAAAAIEDMQAAGVVDNVVEVGLLSVPWIDSAGKIGGHNVCVFRYYQDKTDAKSKWAHLSNWAAGTIFGPFDSLEDVVKNVLGSRVSLGWAYWDVDLKLRRYGGGKAVSK